MVEELPGNVKKCPLGFEQCLGQFCRSYYLENDLKPKCIFPKEVRDKTFAKRIRRYARENLLQPLMQRADGQCEDCGNKNKSNLQIHHIRYTKNLEDMELLCQSCHQKLHILSHHKRFLEKVIDRLGMYDQSMRVEDVIKELKSKVEQNRYDWSPSGKH